MKKFDVKFKATFSTILEDSKSGIGSSFTTRTLKGTISAKGFRSAISKVITDAEGKVAKEVAKNVRVDAECLFLTSITISSIKKAK